VAESGRDEDGRWLPAFEGQRPPFERRNSAATKHGAYSTLRVGPRAAELADEIREAMPLRSPADEATLRLLALALARVEAASAALDRVDQNSASELSPYMIESAPQLGRLREDLRSWLSTAAKLAASLGLTPVSRAKLGLNVAMTERALGGTLLERYREPGDDS
jgi:hypothetical protein